jgi:ribose 5-phosphate isomerase A
MSAAVEEAKRLAAVKAVDDHFLPLLLSSASKANGNGVVVLGIGSGSTIEYAVKRLVELRNHHNFTNFVCIPTSFQARKLIIENQLNLSDLERHSEIDATIDGADEVDYLGNCIKGGGGCHLQEKIVAFNSKKLVIVADYRKKSDVLGISWKAGVPLEVLSLAYTVVLKKLKEMGGRPQIRMSKTKAGPCISDNGNMLIDCDFGQIKDVADLELRLKHVPGVLETGLFVNMAISAYFGNQDGTVEVKNFKS